MFVNFRIRHDIEYNDKSIHSISELINENKELIICQLDFTDTSVFDLIDADNAKTFNYKFEKSAHANLLIINTKYKTIDKFEPSGKNDYLGFKIDNIESRIKNILYHLDPRLREYIYYTEWNTGPQLIISPSTI